MDNKKLYVLRNKKDEERAGLYIYDIEYLMEKKKLVKFFIDSAIVGNNKILDFSSDN